MAARKLSFSIFAFGRSGVRFAALGLLSDDTILSRDFLELS